ncbi:MAG TPA: hypothetical protein VFF28_03730 [Candidatus Nanoarchaeia archaeon]|nr:hypothetical protein [Candidatus Nanoarchaeia archaeon]
MALSRRDVLRGAALLGISGLDNEQPIRSNLEELTLDEYGCVVLPQGDAVATNIWVPDLDIFRVNGIKYLFVDIGHMDRKTGIMTTPNYQIDSFLLRVAEFENRTGHRFILMPWNVVYASAQEPVSEFGSEAFRRNFISEYLALVGKGFDGIHLDVEAIPVAKPGEIDQRALYLQMAADLRSELPKNKILSCYAPGVGDPRQNVYAWDKDYWTYMASIFNLMTIQTYDTGQLTKEGFEAALSIQLDLVKSVNAALAATHHSSIMWPIPTHKPSPETMQASIEWYNKSIGARAADYGIIGLFLFASWTMRPEHWAYYKASKAV